MNDSNLKALQEIYANAHDLQLKMRAFMVAISTSGDNGVTVDVYPNQYTELKSADECFSNALDYIAKEIEGELKKRRML